MFARYMNKVSRVLPLALLCMFSDGVSAQRVEIVDLGLSVKWASMNVGANSPEEYGEYFAWGEIAPKRYYGTYSTYKHFDATRFHKYNYLPYQGSVMDDLLRLEESDDAASKRMGKGWRMPTEAEMNELLDTAKCIVSSGELNGTRGFWVTRRHPLNSDVMSGRKSSHVKRDSLFLPMAGYKDFGTYRFFPGTQCYYWTSTLVTPDSLSVAKKDSLAADKVKQAKCFMYSGENVPMVDLFNRKNGCVIRAVHGR